jgi:hypothetical protein
LLKPPLNLPGPGRDHNTHHRAAWGQIFMQSIRPDNADPIPLRTSPHRMGTIMIRSIGLLVTAVVVLALIWSR